MEKKETFRFGVMGAGNISNKFCDAAEKTEEVCVTAVAARSEERAREFAEKYEIHSYYGNYEEMLQKEKLDGVYIGVVTGMHVQLTELCIRYGIPVLCEKPMAPSFGQCKELFAVAKQNSLFLMEGMWTRLLPTTKRVKEWISTGRIGKVIALNATFCARVFPNENDRVFDLCQAGGALLDMGVYPLSLADMVFGKSPCAIASLANINRYGVDDNDGIVLQYDDGELATILISLNGQGRD